MNIAGIIVNGSEEDIDRFHYYLTFPEFFIGNQKLSYSANTKNITGANTGVLFGKRDNPTSSHYEFNKANIRASGFISNELLFIEDIKSIDESIEFLKSKISGQIIYFMERMNSIHVFTYRGNKKHEETYTKTSHDDFPEWQRVIEPSFIGHENKIRFESKESLIETIFDENISDPVDQICMTGLFKESKPLQGMFSDHAMRYLLEKAAEDTDVAKILGKERGLLFNRLHVGIVSGFFARTEKENFGAHKIIDNMNNEYFHVSNKSRRLSVVSMSPEQIAKRSEEFEPIIKEALLSKNTSEYKSVFFEKFIDSFGLERVEDSMIEGPIIKSIYNRKLIEKEMRGNNGEKIFKRSSALL